MVTSPNSTRGFGSSRFRFASFMSLMREYWAWYDTHLPSVPQVDESPLRGPRSERAADMTETL